LTILLNVTLSRHHKSQLVLVIIVAALGELYSNASYPNTYP